MTEHALDPDVICTCHSLKRDEKLPVQAELVTPLVSAKREWTAPAADVSRRSCPRMADVREAA